MNFWTPLQAHRLAPSLDSLLLSCLKFMTSPLFMPVSLVYMWGQWMHLTFFVREIQSRATLLLDFKQNVNINRLSHLLFTWDCVFMMGSCNSLDLNCNTFILWRPQTRALVFLVSSSRRKSVIFPSRPCSLHVAPSSLSHSRGTSALNEGKISKAQEQDKHHSMHSFRLDVTQLLVIFLLCFSPSLFFILIVVHDCTSQLSLCFVLL